MSGRPGASPIGALARRGVTQPIAAPVPADDAHFLASKGELRVALRVLRRRLELTLSGQRRHLVEHIDRRWKRAIWFHAEAPQIGDALMDLAPRSLLAAHGIALDLVAPPTTAALFSGDRWFGRVAADTSAVTADASHAYDFAIVDSVSRRALAAKRRVAPELPCVAIQGDYLAYDYQRALFATRRLAAMLSLTLSAADERAHAQQKLRIGAMAMPGRDEPPRIAIAVGGVRAERSYRAWPAVAKALVDRGWRRFALLGSDNGAADAVAVREAIGDADVLDLVARTDLHGTQRAMAQCALVLCSDGGLMHLACTTTTPLVALFDAAVDPAWRLPGDAAGSALRARGPDVNGIAPDAVVARAILALALDRTPTATDDMPGALVAR